MLKIKLIPIVALFFYAVCSAPENQTKALSLNKPEIKVVDKKPGFDPIKHGFSCDSLNVKIQKSGNKTEKLFVFLGSKAVDTLNLQSLSLDINEKEIMIMDYNYDGFCDLVLNNILSASHGAMDYYYFLYDSNVLKYKETRSLPKFNGGFKLDIKNQRVKIYCPYQDCFAYYKYNENGLFELVQGKFEINP